MKLIKTLSATLGPFNELQTLEDRYSADGADYPFSALGEHTVQEATAEATAVATVVPETLNARQIRRALTALGLREKLEEAISFSDQDTRDWYEFSGEFRRDHPLVLELAEHLEVSPAELDQLWIVGVSL